MISDSAYIEIMKNCSKWNSKTVCNKKRSDTAIFDQQTGVVQRPTDFLHRHYTERRKPLYAAQVCAYTADRWNKPKEISSDSCEMKYFLNISPALNEAIIGLSNPNNTINTIANELSFNESNSALRSMYSKYDMSEMDISEYDIEEPENDPSDEDDWGASKRRRKRNNPNATPKPRRTTNTNGNANGNGSGGGSAVANGTPTPFVCQICGAKYKSRPGLTYHRIHVHQDGVAHPRNTSSNSSAAAGGVPLEEIISKSPIAPIVPSFQVSDTCDFCLGDKTKNVDGKAEDLVSCHDCGRSAHPSCSKFTPNMLTSTKRYGWQCLECKSCAVCGTSEHDDQLLFCDDCDRGFHLYCLKPPLEKPPDTDWSCNLCQSVYGERASINIAKAKAAAAK